MSGKDAELEELYKSPLHYKELFDLTKKGLKNYIKGEDSNYNKTNQYSFLYLYLIFNPSTRKEIAESFRKYMDEKDEKDEKGEKKFREFNVKSIVSGKRRVRCAREMLERGLLFTEGENPEVLHANIEPLFNKYRWVDLPSDRKKELWENSKARIDWGEDDNEFDYPVFRENCWIDNYVGIDWGDSGFDYPESNKNRRLKMDSFVTTLMALTFSKMEVDETKLLTHIFKSARETERFNYKTVLHMITLVLNKVYKRIPASIWKGDGYREGKIAKKMESEYDDDFFLDTKEFPDKLRESFEDVV
ncbi:MAG: hypothetical protein V5A88_10290, partial [Candidatus Thermoplasmatota archaeon]